MLKKVINGLYVIVRAACRWKTCFNCNPNGRGGASQLPTYVAYRGVVPRTSKNQICGSGRVKDLWSPTESPGEYRKTFVEVRHLGRVHSAQGGMFDSNLIITDDITKTSFLIMHLSQIVRINCCFTI